MPPLKNSSPSFIGREKHLQRLKEYFGTNANGHRKSFLLYGLGGTGKTQICLKFIEQNPGLFYGIYWLDASSEATIEHGLMQIAQVNNVTQNARGSSGQVLQWISQYSKWLLIFDNADGDYTVVEKFLPPGTGGNILITSRNAELRRLVMDSMNIVDMEDDEAIYLLLKSAMLDGTSNSVKDAAKRVVSELGGIPLALDQAGAYIQRCGCGFEGYLELYKWNKQKLLSRREFKGASGYGKSTYGTWDISMQQIESMATKGNEDEGKAAKTAIRLLRIFAFLNHENIPQELFKNAAENYSNKNADKVKLDFPLALWDDQALFLDEGQWDKMCFLDGIHVLLSFSLIKTDNNLYSMHILVHAWSKSCIPNGEIINHYQSARALLSCSVIPDWNLDNYAFCRLLVPQIRSNLLHASELRIQQQYHNCEYDRFAIVFDHAGSWNEKEKVLQEAVRERKQRLGSGHPSVLTTMEHLSTTYQDQGRWYEAEVLQLEVMSVRKERIGPDHPSTFIIMDKLAWTYRSQGRLYEAEKLQLEVLNAQKTKIGPDHPSTLITMEHLAATYRDQGRWHEAEKLQLEVINANKGKQVPDSSALNTMDKLAWTYQDQGRLHEAESLQSEVLTARKEKLGLDHPSTLSSMHNLASIYQDQGRWNEAEKLQLEALNRKKEKLGPDHPNSHNTTSSLAWTYWNQDRLHEAEKLQLEALGGFKRKLGSDHPRTLGTLDKLALTYQSQGRLYEAEKLQLYVLHVWKGRLQSGHPTILSSMHNLAMIYQNQERWDEAEKLQLEVLNGRKEKLGSDHKSTLATIEALAWTYWNQGRLDEAKALQLEAQNRNK